MNMPDDMQNNDARAPETFPEQNEPAIVYHNPVAQRRHDSMQWMKGAVAFLLAVLAAGGMYLGARSFIESSLSSIGVVEEPSSQEAAEGEEAGDQQEQGEGAQEGAEPEPEEGSEEPPPAPSFANKAASSELPPDGDSRSYAVGNVADGDLKTAWNEGSPGDGTGEWVEFTADEQQHVKGIRIATGFQSDEGTYYNNNRPSKVKLSFDDQTDVEYELADTFGDYQTINLPEEKDTKSLRVTIMSVYYGNAYSDCCISEIEIF